MAASETTRLLDNLDRLAQQEGQLAQLALTKSRDILADGDDHQTLLVTSMYHQKLAGILEQAAQYIRNVEAALT